MATVTIKQHDTARMLEDVLKLNGVPIDLTGATVRLALRNSLDASSSLKPDASIVAPATDGKVRFSFDTDMVSTPGTFFFEWEVQFLNGDILTVPDDSFHTLQILADIA